MRKKIIRALSLERTGFTAKQSLKSELTDGNLESLPKHRMLKKISTVIDGMFVSPKIHMLKSTPPCGINKR